MADDRRFGIALRTELKVHRNGHRSAEIPCVESKIACRIGPCSPLGSHRKTA